MVYKNKGFTIVELLVVIVVIGILAAITIISYTGISQRATIASLQSDLSAASNLLKLDQVTDGQYPTSLDLANNGKGVPHSPDTTYTSYIYNNTSSQQTFCITANKSNTDYKITNNSSAVAGACQTSGIVTSGLIINLDAGNTASYPSPFNSTSIADLSGNNNHATLVNGVGYDSSSGGSLVFDGVNDYARTNNVSVGSTFTVNLWFKPYALSLGSYNRIIENNYTTSLYIGMDTTGTKYQFIVNNSTAPFGNLTSPVITSTAWTNITGVYDGTNGSLYINGSLIASVAFTAPSTYTAPIYFDTYYLSPSTYPAKGSIGNVQIYNRPLTGTELTQNYNALRGRYGL